MNAMKTTLLLTALTLILVLGGQLLAGQGGMIIALVIAGAMNMGAYWFSDRIVLRMSRARQVTEAEAPQLYAIVRELAGQASLPMPKVYLIDDPSPNAFATGRNPQHAAVAATTGIMSLLTREELSGVMAHELAHVGNRDILIGSISATIAGTISMLANMAQWAMIFGGGRGDEDNGPGGMIASIAMMILAPMAAMLVQMAISRSREYGADEGGARICGNPLWLASALRKLERGAEAIPMPVNPSTAHMYIVSPLTGGLRGLFSTHPPIDERVRRLEALALRWAQT